MLTVKVIRPDGSEWIEEATSVCVNNPNQSQSNNRSITYFIDHERPIDVFEGNVYVMNESGRTVADYHLWISPTGEGKPEPEKPNLQN